MVRSGLQHFTSNPTWRISKSEFTTWKAGEHACPASYRLGLGPLNLARCPNLWFGCVWISELENLCNPLCEEMIRTLTRCIPCSGPKRDASWAIRYAGLVDHGHLKLGHHPANPCRVDPESPQAWGRGCQDSHPKDGQDPLKKRFPKNWFGLDELVEGHIVWDDQIFLHVPCLHKVQLARLHSCWNIEIHLVWRTRWGLLFRDILAA